MKALHKLRHQTYYSQYMMKKLSRMHLSQQLHITELLKGFIIKQDFYNVSQDNKQLIEINPMEKSGT